MEVKMVAKEDIEGGQDLTPPLSHSLHNSFLSSTDLSAAFRLLSLFQSPPSTCPQPRLFGLLTNRDKLLSSEETSRTMSFWRRLRCVWFLLSETNNTAAFHYQPNMRIVPHGKIDVCSSSELVQGCERDDGPRIVVRSIKRIKKGEEVTIAYTDLLQPKDATESEE
ncbi:hypothetical protein Pint_07911 [Pistacia integerrima]|uniref:Uncharacterized protein n=1 Tax=Pistacia integerrima TaxID=434235 RepID=A0ACC0XS60_9ROSI|nr:hypothetical protein Pint_07911 [Pistacia integerrima]